MHIDTSFPGARATVLAADGPSAIRLAIPPDHNAARYRQWFSFAVTGARGKALSITIDDAKGCTWGDAFAAPYRVWASDDGGATWARTTSALDGEGALRIEHPAGGDRVCFAYYPPWNDDRLAALIQRAGRRPFARGRDVGRSVEGRPLPLLEVGRDDIAPIWIIAQQHPGEPMAGWMVEGLVDLLLDRDDGVARTARDKLGFAIVPRMNPDGVAHGNHRTNAAGLDLNRQWAVPDEKAPEVKNVRAAMHASGVAAFLDVHGDERQPYVFAQGTDGIPSRTENMAADELRFAESLMGVSKDFQTQHGYPRDKPGRAHLGIAANWVGETFKCLSLTLEMPYSDHLAFPLDEGFSPDRAKRFGRALLETLVDVVG